MAFQNQRKAHAIVIVCDDKFTVNQIIQPVFHTNVISWVEFQQCFRFREAIDVNKIPQLAVMIDQQNIIALQQELPLPVIAAFNISEDKALVCFNCFRCRTLCTVNIELLVTQKYGV